jgi:hypothetical protein
MLAGYRQITMLEDVRARPKVACQGQSMGAAPGLVAYIRQDVCGGVIHR